MACPSNPREHLMVAKPKQMKLKRVATVEYERQLWQARYSPCGEYLIGCGYDASLQRWKLDKAKLTQRKAFTGHHGWLQCMGFHPKSGQVFTADSWGKLAAWKYNDESGKPQWQHEAAHDGWIRALSVSPDGQWVVTAGNDRVVRVWETRSGGKKLEWKDAHPDRIFSLAFHPNGKVLFTGDLRGVIRQCEFPSGKLIRKLDAGKLYKLHRIQECGGARTMSLSKKGDRLVCAGQQDCKGGFAGGTPAAIVFDTASGKQLNQIKVGGNADGFVYDAQFHPDGYVMATASAFPGKGHLWFWNPNEKKPFFEDRKLTNGRSISVHPKSGQLAMLAANSPNANGRRLKNGKYQGGSSKIYLLSSA